MNFVDGDFPLNICYTVIVKLNTLVCETKGISSRCWKVYKANGSPERNLSERKAKRATDGEVEHN